MTEPKKPGFAERFAAAYEKSMKQAVQEEAKAPEVGEGLIDVVDPTTNTSGKPDVHGEVMVLTDKQAAAFDRDPRELKREMFADWRKEHPGGTSEEFEVDWGIVTAVFGPSP
jgi:hypothetical protein